MTHHVKHWEYVYRHRRRSKSSDLKQIIFGQLFTVGVSFWAGLALENVKHTLILVTGVLLLMPGVVDMCASITGALGARINHQLDTSDHTRKRILIESVSHAIVLSLLSGTLLSVIGSLIAILLFDANFFKLLEISTTTILVTSFLCFPLIALLTLFIKNRGYDPDNIIGPVQASIIDIVAIIMLAVSVGIFT